MKGGAQGKGLPLETDRAGRPAAPVPPATKSANEIDPLSGLPARVTREFDYGAIIEATGRTHPFPGLEDQEDAGVAEIDAEFRRRLRGLRHLRRGERAQALRAAREWRFLALKALKQKRAHDRRDRFMQWHRGQPPPRQFG
jgi:hypothetical protein